MPATQAMIGYGTVLEIALASAPSSFTYIAETRSHTPPSFSDATANVTHMQSPNRMHEYIAGLSDPSETSHEMNYVPGSPTDMFCRAIAGKALIARLTFPNGRQIIYNAVRAGYETNIPLDEGLSATLTLKVSGNPTVTAVTLPRNLVAPVITGTPKVGVPLVVDPGIWAGAEALSPQWEVAGTPVVDATGTSYVPVAGDAGDKVLVAVTGTNTAGSTAVDSAETEVVAS